MSLSGKNNIFFWVINQNFRLEYLTLSVVYKYMMPWPLHCKRRAEPPKKRNFTKYTFNTASTTS